MEIQGSLYSVSDPLFVEPDCLCTHPLDLFLDRAYVFRGTRKLVPISPNRFSQYLSLSLGTSIIYSYYFDLIIV